MRLILAMVSLAALLIALAGCRSVPLQHDELPDPAQCGQAKAAAIDWFRARYHREPVCPPCRVTHEAQPMGGMGGWCTGTSGIHIWVGQLQDETHEWRHWLCGKTFGDWSEEAVR